MKRLFTTTLSLFSLASLASPASTLAGRFEKEFYEGLGSTLTGRIAQALDEQELEDE